MASRGIYTKLERWFTEVAVKRGLISSAEVHGAIEEQVNSRQKEGRTPHIWEILLIQDKLRAEAVDDILAGLGKNTEDSGEHGGFNLLGRVLVEVGYAEPSDIHEALALQAQERADGQWRLLGQILISMKVLREPDLQEAIAILERRRKPAPPKE
ncbi:MAG: hypothetical protein HOK97_18690 [Deltaproteobacteria bacterium]|jgi:hypothetical protein|nr:hypothetical protein [Deltaproteobacteria bacterium]MBT6491803.1 hypothetical protein [Deltaproteobacteria bacterium]